MPRIEVAPETLDELANAIRSARQDYQQINDRLVSQVNALESEWHGASQQAFFQSFNEWQAYLSSALLLFDTISAELGALSQRLSESSSDS
jgi:WXG100 family type VII secretion target